MRKFILLAALMGSALTLAPLAAEAQIHVDVGPRHHRFYHRHWHHWHHRGY